MPNTAGTDRRLDKLGLWALQTVFGIGLLVASWFLGGLYERLEKVDDKVNQNTTATHVNAEKLKSSSQSNGKQWERISKLQSEIDQLKAEIRVINARISAN